MRAMLFPPMNNFSPLYDNQSAFSFCQTEKNTPASQVHESFIQVEYKQVHKSFIQIEYKAGQKSFIQIAYKAGV
jgi:hypothetical protein